MYKQKIFCIQKLKSLLPIATLLSGLDYITLLLSMILAGNLIGEQGISVVNLTAPLYSFTMFISALIAAGSATTFAYEIGKFNKEKAHQIFTQGLITAIAASILIFLLGFILKNYYIGFMNPSKEIEQKLIQYWKYFHLLISVYPILVYFNKIVYSDGDNKLLAIAITFLFFSNIVLSFLFYKKLGIEGLSLSAFIAVCISLCVLICHLFRKSSNLKFKFCFKIPSIFMTFKYSLDDAMGFLYNSIWTFTLTKFIISNFGDFYLPVFSIIMSITELTILFDGIGTAINPLISVYKGEQNSVCIREIMKHATKYALYEGCAVCLLLLLFANKTALIFDIQNPELLSLTKTAVLIISPMLIFVSILFLYQTYYLIIDKVKLTLLISGLKDLLLINACAIICGHYFGIHGVWIGMTTSAFLTFIISSSVIYTHYGKIKFPLIIINDFDKIRSYNIEVTTERIANLQNLVEQFLKYRNIPQSTTLKVLLLIEELMHLIREKNEPKQILAEFTISINDHEINAVIRDTGKIFDITDEDNQLISLRSFLVSEMMKDMDNKAYLTTTNFNRQVFKFEY
ncbi:MAG: hypothetical protein MJ247_00090 [Alphaproteobacteria bacterium]|nr:hypothetical protein [Alphaproteobacteria bacterium]